MAVRNFDGSDDAIVMLPGSLVGLTGGPSTWACLIQRNSTAFNIIFSMRPDATTTSTAFGQANSHSISNTGGVIRFSTGPAFGGADSDSSTLTVLNADGWVGLVGTKTSGNTAPRSHKYVLSTSTMTRETHVATIANGSAITSAYRLKFGRDEFGNKYAGSIAVAGWWNVAMSDAEVDELWTNLATADWLTHSVGPPKYLYEFNQTDVRDPVLDLTDGGANQETILGTNVVSTIAAPTYQERAAAQSAAASTSVALNHPASLAVGDLMIATFADHAAADDSALASQPSGWSTAGRQRGGADNDNTLWWSWKVATSGDVSAGSSTWTFTAAQNWHSPGIVRVTGHNAASPINQSAMNVTPSAGSTHTTSSITPNINNCLIMAFWVMGSGTATFTLDASLTSRYNANLQSLISTFGDVAQTTAAAVSKASTSSTGQTAAMLILAVAPGGVDTADPPGWTFLGKSPGVSSALYTPMRT